MATRSENSARRFTNEQRLEVRFLVHAGKSFAQVAEQVGCSKKLVQRVLNATGGLAPRIVPRAPLRLSMAEREEISCGLQAGETLRAIGRRLGRAPSTISREVAANGGKSAYRAWRADGSATQRTRRPKVMKLAREGRLRDEVELLLGRKWSPQQIVQWLKMQYPRDQAMWVSHETIYRSVFIQSRGTLRRELAASLRTGRTRRKSRKGAEHNGSGRLPEMVNISERPAEVADRAVPGHWEGDLIMGRSGRSAVATLVERRSRFVVLVRLGDVHTAGHVCAALTERVRAIPELLFRSLTWDQGKEMASHARFTVDTGVKVYFCDPHSPWQRGTNENTNGLLRQYLPKQTDLGVHDQAALDAIAHELNGRPRQTLEWKTPSQRLAEVVVASRDVV